MATLLPEGKQSFNNSAGAPLVGGKVYTYDAGTSTPRTTYADAAGTVPNTNPVILDTRGEATIFWSGAYKVVLKDAADVTIWTVDNIISADIVDIGAQPKFSASVATSIGGYPVGYVLQDNAGLNSYVNIVAANTTDFNTTPASIGVSWIPYAGQTATQSGSSTSAAAAGTVDAITATYTPALTALTNGIVLRFRPTGANTSTTPTFSPNGLTAKTIVRGANQPLLVGDIAGVAAWAEVQYDSTLDKWVLINPAVFTPSTVQGLFKNLAVSATGASANVSVTVDEIVVQGAANAYQTLRTVALNIAGTASGVANGLDTGALAANSWYSVWVIWNGVTTAGLLSLSATAPALPAGYTHKARVGWIKTDGTGNKFPLNFRQYGKRVRYAVGGNVTGVPLIATGAVGNTATPTYVSNQIQANSSVTGVIPSTAPVACMYLAERGGSSQSICAPSNAYGAYSSTTNPPPMIAGVASVATSVNCLAYDMILESINVFYALGSGSSQLFVLGWEDNL
jgi:hypothetical protein